MPFVSLILYRGLTTAALALILLACAGCSSPVRPVSSPAAGLRPTVIGEIAVVDEEQGFVLIDLDSYLHVPKPGDALHAISPKGEIAELKASPEQKRPFVAADILDGHPAVGDQVSE